MAKLNRKLTETEIRNAKPRDKDYKLYDDGGLRLLVRKSGTKVWQYPYIQRRSPGCWQKTQSDFSIINQTLESKK